MTVLLLRVGFGRIGGLKPTLQPRPTIRLANLSTPALVCLKWVKLRTSRLPVSGRGAGSIYLSIKQGNMQHEERQPPTPSRRTAPAYRRYARAIPIPTKTFFGGWIMSQMDLGGGIMAAEIAQGRIVTNRHSGNKLHQPTRQRQQRRLLLRIFASAWAILPSGKVEMRVKAMNDCVTETATS